VSGCPKPSKLPSLSRHQGGALTLAALARIVAVDIGDAVVRPQPGNVDLRAWRRPEVRIDAGFYNRLCDIP
jgi:hypothetical protein